MIQPCLVSEATQDQTPWLLGQEGGWEERTAVKAMDNFKMTNEVSVRQKYWPTFKSITIQKSGLKAEKNQRMPFDLLRRVSDINCLSGSNQLRDGYSNRGYQEFKDNHIHK